MSEVAPVPTIRGICKFTPEMRYANVTANLKHKFSDLYELIMMARPGGTAAIVGAGQSINGELNDLRQLVQGGATTFVIGRMYPWYVQHVGLPDYVVSMDAVDEVGLEFDTLHPGVKYLVSTIAQPKAVSKLRGRRAQVYTFTPLANNGANPEIDDNIAKIMRAHGVNGHTVIKTGSCGVLCSMILATILGHTMQHVFGFDCKYQSEPKDLFMEGYADGVIGKGIVKEPIKVNVKGRDIWTSKAFMSYVQQFFLMINWLYKAGKIREVSIYGDSLISDMWDGKFHDAKALPGANVAPGKVPDAPGDGGSGLHQGSPSPQPPGQVQPV